MHWGSRESVVVAAVSAVVAVASVVAVAFAAAVVVAVASAAAVDWKGEAMTSTPSVGDSCAAGCVERRACAVGTETGRQVGAVVGPPITRRTVNCDKCLIELHYRLCAKE